MISSEKLHDPTGHNRDDLHDRHQHQAVREVVDFAQRAAGRLLK